MVPDMARRYPGYELVTCTVWRPRASRANVLMDQAQAWQIGASVKSTCLLFVALTLVLCDWAIAEPSPAAPAQMISRYRLQHGKTKVVADRALTKMAQEQAAAMASRDNLDHSVLAPFSSRIAAAGSGRAAENIAYGHDGFPLTLNQWIKSAEHRNNLLMDGASLVGVASAKSPRTSRTYWAMVISGGAKRAKAPPAKRQKQPRACRVTILSLCL
jgi:hypothetical protein